MENQKSGNNKNVDAVRARAGVCDELTSETLGVAGSRTGDAVQGMCRYAKTDMNSLDVKIAADVAQPNMEEISLTHFPVHVMTTAAILSEMMNIGGSAVFENCETEFRYSRCIIQVSVEALVLVVRIVKNVMRKLAKTWETKGWGLWFGGMEDKERRVASMVGRTTSGCTL